MRFRKFTLLVFSVMLLILLPVTVLAAQPELQNGTCGSLVWEFEDGNLSISGNGPMEDFTFWEPPPWIHLAEEVTEIQIAQGVTTVGNMAFSDFAALETVILPDSMTAIGSSAFWNCPNLCFIYNSQREQSIPNGVTSIGNDAFTGCNIYRLSLGQSVSYIGNRAFSGCTALVHIDLSPALTYVDDYAFLGCVNLKGIFFPQQVSYIGEGAFGDCFRMKNIHFTGSAPEIHESAFASFSYVAQQIQATVYYPEGDPSWNTDNNYGAQFSWCPVNSPFITSGTWGNLFWKFEDDGYLTISGNGPMPECSTVGDAPWSQLTSYVEIVYIQEGVTTVCDYAFFDFSAVTTLILPDSMVTIGQSAFFNCKGLTWIFNSQLEQAIPDGVQTIGNNAFVGCSLTDLDLGNGVVSIGECAFHNCAKLKQIRLSPSLQHIGPHGFSGCYQLDSMTIPASVTHIDAHAFGDCYGLQTIYFDGNAPQIHETAFVSMFDPIQASAFYPGGNSTWTVEKQANYGGQLTWYQIPADCLGIGICGENVTWELKRSGLMIISGTGPMYNYYNVDNPSYAPWYGMKDAITRLVVENGVTTIGETTFYKCYNLSEISLPDSVSSIESYAFFDCNGLLSVNIGARVTNIAYASIFACDSLQSITVDPKNPYYSSDDRGVLFNKQKTCLITAPGAISGDYQIPNGVTEIGSYAFNGCEFMTSVTIPSTVTTIENGAFSTCFRLKSVVIPENVSYIGRCAFWSCVRLTEIRFCGDAPIMGEDLFVKVIATAAYPRNNATWTKEVMQSYGGELTWVPYGTILRGDLNSDGWVDNLDVEYLLWHTLFPEDYSLNQDGDFNGDALVDNLDVEYLLWHTLFPEDYPLTD